jgi:Spy/CpxP family protein refolding chaperone
MIKIKEGGFVRRITILAAIVISLVAVGLQAQAPKMACLSDEMKLTEAQEKQMQASFLTEQKEMVQLRADLEKAKIEMKEIMMSDNIDKAAALKKVDQISAAKTAIAKRKLSGHLDRLSILTPEQRKQCPKGPMMGEGRRGPRGEGCCDKGMRGGRGPGRGGDCPKMGAPGDKDDD